ncbi:alkyl hydroperoxide reductase [Kiloniella spongiae]|uniref:Glutathione-dependent peroxiredoxin n=1 Tax=Kiloniella spongiae TaxID=1489064 RepID=A0A0H2MKD3_9PROT|nr:peroxiredoxin [Kiloniella spongiae]KLN62651.1 alkyl hydroperoxide reductase [Kiloniella spongiae]
MTISVGDKVPSVSVWNKNAEGIDKLDFAEFCAGKTVAFFAVPGAFTPTCQEQHFPSYKENAQKLQDKGVDVIACMSVNDPFVMKAWGDLLDPEGDIVMLADGLCELAKALGLTIDASGVGLGQRAARFSMLIKDGVVASLHVEEAGAYEASAAEVMLNDL